MGTTDPTYAPVPRSLAGLARDIAACRRCPLYANATQAVSGAGPGHAPLMLFGEQPGNDEDLAGRPFVGPAGKLLSKALAEAGIARETAFITNAVKHFKFAPRGKRRLHQRPNAEELALCRWWLALEERLVRPRLIVALGASAARSVFGRTVTISKIRGAVQMVGETRVLATIHPSYLLRIPDPESRAREYAGLVRDLKMAREVLAQGPV